MDWLQVIILSLLQGVTEFLPVSSSAHLTLLPKLLGWQDPGLAFEVMVHGGTLLATLGYFRQEIWCFMRDSYLWITTKQSTAYSKLALFIVVGTIPVVIAGGLLHDFIANLRSIKLLALASLLFGFFLLYAVLKARSKYTEYELSWPKLWVIALLQSLALIPGVSRSGITITAGLLVGLNKEAAARFSFLLGVPVIAAAFCLESYKLIQTNMHLNTYLLGAFCCSALIAYWFIGFFLWLLQKIGYFPFVVYRILLSLLLLGWQL